MHYYFSFFFLHAESSLSAEKSQLQIVRNSATDGLMQLFILSIFDLTGNVLSHQSRKKKIDTRLENQ